MVFYQHKCEFGGVNIRYLGIVVVILAMMIILGTFLTYIWMDNIIGDGDDVFVELVECNVSNLGEDTTVRILNVTQDSTKQVNFTLTSKTDQELLIPLNLRLMVLISETYNGELDSFIPSPDIPNHFHYNQSAQNKLFSYTFNPNQLVLQPFESNSSILTLEVVEDAPLGFYIFNIGPIDFDTHRMYSQLDVVVDPKLG